MEIGNQNQEEKKNIDLSDRLDDVIEQRRQDHYQEKKKKRKLSRKRKRIYILLVAVLWIATVIIIIFLLRDKNTQIKEYISPDELWKQYQQDYQQDNE